MKKGYWIILAGVSVLVVVGLLTRSYITHDESRLFALNAKTGHVQWSAPLKATHAYPPTAGNGMVFAVSKLADPTTLSAFDAATGQLLWEYAIDLQQFKLVDASINNPPVSNKDQVAFGINESTLCVLDIRSGVLLWHITEIVNPYKTQAFTFADDRLIVISQDGTLQALDSQTGIPVWESVLESVEYLSMSLDQPAITANDRLVFVSGSHSVEAFDLQSGILQFSVETASRQLQAVENTLYINTSTSIMAVDAATGALLWTFAVPPASESHPEFFGMQTVGHVTYIANAFWPEGDGQEGEGAWLFALNASDGQELWRRQLRDATSRDAVLDFLHLLPVSNVEVFLITLPVGEHDPFLLSVDNGAKQGVENDMLMAFSTVDGTELWRFPIQQREHFVASPTLQDDLVFVTDRAPRWRNWLTSRNSAWPD
ncbi:MAG: PQQ-binding-like beta-propeller repeat protein [Anaerolineae bacterium]|nr:PQQ-binding-like beta-propeller repeat protein [Anaerolineae bacterium]